MPPEKRPLDTMEAGRFVARFQETKQPSNLLSLNPGLDQDRTFKRPRLMSDQSSRIYDYGGSLLPDRPPCTPIERTPQPMSLIGIGQFHGVESTNAPAEVQLDDLQSMADRLRNAMEQHVLDGTKEFLPLGQLRRICTPANVLEELKGSFPQRAQEYADYVCGKTFEEFRKGHSAHKLFVILVLTKELDKLHRFVEAQVCDRHLPFIWDGNNKLCSRDRELISRKPGEERPCFLENEKNFMRCFYREQWQVLVPFISKINNGQVGEYELGADTIMPWTFHQLVGNESGFSQVFKVKIHKDHHTFDDHEYFALKVLNSGTKQEDFQQELYALRKTPSGSHVIDLFATFKVGDELSFLFPWAKGGSLADLMKGEPSQLFTCSPMVVVKWVAEQCEGIAQGLHGIHNADPPIKGRRHPVTNPQLWKDNYGIHGDVKPDNILRFFREESSHELGELTWSDFGMTKFHTEASRSRQPGNGPLSPTYASPEHNAYSHGVSRRSDIWALGCVFTELLTWIIRGRESHEEYRKARLNEQDVGRRRGSWREDRFFGKTFGNDGIPGIPKNLFVKKSVLQCIEDNKKAVSGPGHEVNYLTEFLDFIRDRMLVIDGDKRAASAEVCKFLKEKMQCYRESDCCITLPSLSMVDTQMEDASAPNNCNTNGTIITPPSSARGESFKQDAGGQV